MKSPIDLKKMVKENRAFRRVADLKLFALYTSPVHPENELIETREKSLASGKH